jgi:hypothetical protein
MTEGTEMKTGFADVVYVVSATKSDQSEFWACATPRRVGCTGTAIAPAWMDGKINGLAP